MNRPEVLSPAGSWETLKAALAAGADAVYFGGRRFNARRNAANFEDQDIGEAVRYCHERGVKAYLTLNMLVFGRELEDAVEFAGYCARAGVDAIILQDAGLAKLIHRAAPGLRLHASTQMSAHNLAGVRELAGMGFSRVVLARELSAVEIGEIARSSPIELEIFIHGALCMSVSGQCYLSAMLGGRSGNRGLCAQPCRLPFAAPGGTGRDLSLKDLSLVGQIGELAEMGIRSIKIEGRMKRPEYVAAATSVCADAVLGKPISDERMENLRAVFSRSGFTKGYFEGKTGREMFGYRGYEDVAASQSVLKEYRRLYEGAERPRVRVDFEFFLERGKECLLTARDDAGNRTSAAGMVPENAKSKDVDLPLIRDKLVKTGGTPFFVGEINARITEGLSIPVSEINRLRRQVLEELIRIRGETKEIPFETPEFSTVSENVVENKRELRVFLQKFSQLTGQIRAEADFIWLPAEEIRSHLELAASVLRQGVKIGAALPRAVFGDKEEKRLMENLKAAKKIGIGDARCSNVGAIDIARWAGMILHGGWGLNVTNSQAARMFRERGLVSLECSIEATLADVSDITRSHNDAGLIVYGRLPLMLTRNCPLKNGTHCADCAGAGTLTDRKGCTFPVVCRGQTSELLNDRPIWMLDRRRDLNAVPTAFELLYFTLESPGEVERVVHAWKNAAPANEEFTRGLCYRGVE